MNVCIVGATSAVAIALAKQLATNGHTLILAARGTNRLAPLQKDLQTRHSTSVTLLPCDITDISDRASLCAQAANADVLCVFAGYLGDQDKAMDNESEQQQIIDVNFTSITHILRQFANEFGQRGSGTIVGVSSVAGERGRKSNFVYGSAKAALSTYLDGLRGHLFSQGVHVVKVIPGFMDTPMTAGLDTPKPLTASPEKAANLIYQGILKKKNTVYIDWKWRWVMAIIRNIPEALFKKMNL